MKTLKLSTIYNKKNKQVSVTIPKKKLKKVFMSGIPKYINIEIKGWE